MGQVASGSFVSNTNTCPFASQRRAETLFHLETVMGRGYFSGPTWFSHGLSFYAIKPHYGVPLPPFLNLLSLCLHA